MTYMMDAGILVPVRSSFGLRRRSGTTWNVSLDKLNTVKIKLADVSSVRPSSEQRSVVSNKHAHDA